MNGGIFFFVTVVIAVFSVLNPIGAIPTLVSLTESFPKVERLKVITRSILVASGMIIGFMLVGVYIFSVLGIDITDFKIAGGILLFKVAFDMLQGKTSNTKLTEQEKEEYMDKDAIGIVPIGTPLLAGPGSITTAIIYFNSKSTTLSEKFLTLAAILVVMMISYLLLRYSIGLFDHLGKTGSLLISRIMGLLLASIAVDFIATGIITLATSI